MKGMNDMNKKNHEYEVPRMSVIRLEAEDVITASGYGDWEFSDEDMF